VQYALREENDVGGWLIPLKGGDAMSDYEVLSIIIKIAKFVLQLMSLKKKNQPPPGKDNG
jgi:hypothetical protein